MKMSPNILAIVEDDPLQLDILAEAMSNLGLETQSFMYVPSVEEVASLPQPDVVLLDIHLRDSSGRDTAVLAHTAWPGIPKVVYTGDDSASTRLSCLAEGCDEVVIKGSANSDIDRLYRILRESYIRRQGQLAYNCGNAVASARLALESARQVRPTLQRLLELAPLVLPKEVLDGQE